MNRTCPDCRYPMVTERHHDLDLDMCRNCAGIWFDAEELRRLMTADAAGLSALEAQLAPRVTQQKIKPGVITCPCCNSLLHIYHFQYDSPVELHACDNCGGCWVQEGELEKMQQWREQCASGRARSGAKGDGHEDIKKAPELPLAHAGTHQDRAANRLESIRHICGVLRQHKPIWLMRGIKEK